MEVTPRATTLQDSYLPREDPAQGRQRAFADMILVGGSALPGRRVQPGKEFQNRELCGDRRVHVASALSGWGAL
jgi:hypothetical protein